MDATFRLCWVCLPRRSRALDSTPPSPPPPSLQNRCAPVPFFLFSYFATQHQDALELEGPDPSLGHFIVTRGEDMWLKMVLNDGLLHADLHPVNTRPSSWVWFGFPPACG